MSTLRKGGHVFGCMLSQMASTRFGPVLAGSTLDYAIVDAEHGSRGRSELEALVGMLRGAGITPDRAGTGAQGRVGRNGARCRDRGRPGSLL